MHSGQVLFSERGVLFGGTFFSIFSRQLYANVIEWFACWRIAGCAIKGFQAN
jgi:hypothetical protein